MSETFRTAQRDEVGVVARLQAHSFPGAGRSVAAWESLLAAHPRWDDAWVGEVDGEVVASCMLYRFQQWIAGRRIPMAGVGAVAIAPTHRRRGLAHRLLVEGLRAARERGDLASALYPFRTAFYRRLGYGLAGETHLYRVEPSSFPDDEARRRVRAADPQGDGAAVRGVYDAWIRHQTGQIERSARGWEALWEPGEVHCVVYWGEGGGAEGYALFRYHTGSSRAARFLGVEEAVWLTPDAQRGIYGWIASLGDQWETVAYPAHPEEGLEERLREPRLADDGAFRWRLWFPAAALLHGPMFRLLDVPRAWEARGVAGDRALTVALEVQDEALPENAGSWRLRMEGGAVGVEEGGGAADLHLGATVDVVSRIFIGALSPGQAVRSGVARVASPERLPELDALLRVPKPSMFDRF